MAYVSSTRGYLMFLANFLNFAGYSAGLVVLSGMGMLALSRELTIPIRLLILACLFGAMCLQGKIFRNEKLLPFILFAACYLARIIIEIFKGHTPHVSVAEILLYFLAFALLPVLILGSLKLSTKDYSMIRNAVLLSCLALAALTLVYFRGVIGTVGRIGKTGEDGITYVSPLILSYCGTMGMGVAISYLIENKTRFFSKLLLLATIGFCLVPFYLGSSRGSILALFLPFIMLFLCKWNIVTSMRMIVFVLAIGGLGVYLGEMFGSSLVDRFTNIGADISANTESAIRLEMWKSGLEQFANNPIFGNFLEVEAFRMYPHNIIIEVLLSTGIIGFIPFTMMIIGGFRTVFWIFRHNPQYAWLGVIYVQSFTQNMFSGCLYNSSWIWFSIGLLYAFEYSVKYSSKAAYGGSWHMPRILANQN